jgi:TPR repeat protein
MFRYGAGVPKDLSEAAKWYGRAAAQGDRLAQNSLGVAYERGDGVQQNLAEAINWYLKAAEQGDAEAQNSLGHIYLSSPASTQAYPEAVRWYRKIHDLDRRLSAVQNFAEAKTWFLKAANQANSYASFNLGIMYEEGLGMPKDSVEAYRWYSLAASQASEGQREYRVNVVKRRDAMAEKMTTKQIEDAGTLPRDWKSK